MRDFFDSIKEFIWDIIGYFLPGSYALILLSACIDNSYFIEHAIETNSKDQNFLIFLIISYIIGYVVYGLGELKESIMSDKSYKKVIEEQVKKRKAFELSKEFISLDLKEKGSSQDINSATVGDIRNIAMSFIPEQDQKIYTFQFRSDLCNNIGNISFLIGLFGLFAFFISLFSSIVVFRLEVQNITLYVFLIIYYLKNNLEE